jgi:hypothetical protein
VPAGRVESIQINPADPAQIFVRIAISPEIPVHHSTYAQLRQRGFTGVAEIELDDSGRHPQPLLTVPDAPARIPLRPSLMQQATEAANINSYQMRASFGDHEAQPGRMLVNEQTPPWVRDALRGKGYTLTFAERTSGPINAIYFDRRHGTIWGGSSDHGEDYGIAW